MENGFRKIELQYNKYGNVQGLMQYINKYSLIKQHKNQIANKATGIDKITKYDYQKRIKQQYRKANKQNENNVIQAKSSKKNLYTKSWKQ